MKNYILTVFCLGFLLIQCKTEPVENFPEFTVVEDSATYSSRQESIMNSVSLQVADGLEVSLWATDSLAPDPIAMSIDDYGKIYLTRTNRQKNSEFDIRGHRDWMTASISLQTVEDRRNFLKTTFATEKSDENQWLKDLNADGIHDWRDLAVEKDEVWRLEDTNGDGIADRSTRVIEDFNEEITDVAGALLVRRNDMFIGIGPDMWRITDRNGDGKWDTKESISHGYAVHIGFGGHGMSGAIEGPDGKIYWGIGDIGANIITPDGRHLKYPNQGVLVRSNPDGSDFEVFAAGLRNTHEFVFDEYGNIIGADNDGDHPGESERLVYIVEGSDAGWRSNWQYGKYTDPKNNEYKVWMDEKLYVPRWEGQAAYIIPPLRNYHNGPTGMVYNPGTALGEKWKNKFFLVEFVGNPSRSPIWSFSLKPSGASFEFADEEKVLQGILPTGIRFGPDGALYAADWINGWDTKNFGRVWKIDVADGANSAERLRTKELMGLNYEDQSVKDLYDLLFYPDMRIRQKAQFELASRGRSGRSALAEAISQKENQLARVHGLWGLGQMIRSEKADGEMITEYLMDSDPEIIAQAAKVLGEVRYTDAGPQLVQLLSNNNPRVQFFAAQALGRIKYEQAVPGLIKMLESNNNEDIYIRHAAVLALSRIGDAEAMVALKNNPSEALRLGAVLVLRRMGNPGVVEFLNDENEYIVTEAARAINDDFSIEEGLPALAEMLVKTNFNSEPLIRRALNASSRLGGNKQADLLLKFVNSEEHSVAMRAEALAILANWSHPSVLDRVDGRYRGEVIRDSSYVREGLMPYIAGLLDSPETEIVKETAVAISNLGIRDFMDKQANLAQQHQDPAVRSAMITSLHELDYESMDNVIERGMNDRDEAVRSVSLSLLDSYEIEKSKLPAIVNPVFRKGTVSEQQQMLKVLGNMPSENSEPILAGLLKDWKSGKISQGVTLELFEAIDSSKSESLIALAEPLRKTGNTTEDYMDVLYGGNRNAGARIYWNNPTAQCTRCHSWDDDPAAVGPSLRGIAGKLSRKQLLESLIEPSARIAPGFGSVSLKLKDGTTVSGVLLEDSDSEILLRTNDAEPLKIEKQRIEERTNYPSAMPPMGLLLSKREIRDLVEYLSTLD